MTIVNDSAKPITITGVSSPAFRMIEMHRTQIQDGIARMVEQQQLKIDASDRLVLEPGSYHLMLMMPGKVPQEDERVELTLEFADGQNRTISAIVRRE